MGRGLIWMQGLVCGGCVAVAPMASLLLAVLLAPAIMALLLERAPGRPLTRAILLCGSAACVSPMMTLWRMGGRDTHTNLALLGDPGFFGAAWAACAAGWLLSQVLPIGIRVVLDEASLSRSARLRAERDRLAQEWGLEDYTNGPK